MKQRPIAMITGVSRKIGIGAAIARTLASQGWDIAFTYWEPYDESMPWGRNESDVSDIAKEIKAVNAREYHVEANLENTDTPKKVFNSVEEHLGPVTALILNHCYSVDSDILLTSIESFDRHFAINGRAVWLLIREFGLRFRFEGIPGRLVSLTSDHTAGNLPYGSSKGAMDRIVLAAADEFRDRRILANVVNPGATDDGWMSEELKDEIRSRTFQNRLGTPQDAANLIGFLCSESGSWINGQILFSNGGFA